MASYYPPTENLPIFDSEVFVQGQIEGEAASGGGGGGGSYLEYPIAQGSETLFSGSSCNGDFTIVGDAILNTISASGTEITCNSPFTMNIGTTLSIKSKIDFINASNNLMVGGTLSGSSFFFSGSRNTGTGLNIFNSITSGSDNSANGYNALTALTSGYNNVAIGSGALQALTTGYGNNAMGYNSLGNCNTGFQNVANGGGALGALTNGSQNTAMGFTSASSISSGTQNTTIGASTGINITSGNQNTTLGYNAGNSMNTNANCVSIGATSNITASKNNSTAIGYGATVSHNTSTAIGYGSATTGDNQIVLGTASETVRIPNRLLMANNTYIYSGNNFNQISFNVNNTTYSTDTSILDTYLLLTATSSGLSFTIPTPVGNANRTLVIANEGGNVFNLLNNNSSNWTGDYGSNTTILIIPDNANMYLFSNGTNWEVWQRTGNVSFDTILTANAGSATNYSLCDSTLRFTNASTGSYTYTLPNPSDNSCHNTYIQVFNQSTTYAQTLSIGSGSFTGPWGSDSSTMILPSYSWVKMYSNGGNWQCNEASTYGWQYPTIAIQQGTITFPNQYFKSYISGLGGVGTTTYYVDNMIAGFKYVNNPIYIRNAVGTYQGTFLNIIRNNTSATNVNNCIWILTSTFSKVPLTGLLYYQNNTNSNIYLTCERVGFGNNSSFATIGTIDVTNGSNVATITLAQNGATGTSNATLVPGSVLTFNDGGGVKTITLGGFNYLSPGGMTLSASTAGTFSLTTTPTYGMVHVGYQFTHSTTGATIYTITSITSGALGTTVALPGGTFTPSVTLAAGNITSALTGSGVYSGGVSQTYGMTSSFVGNTGSYSIISVSDVYGWLA